MEEAIAQLKGAAIGSWRFFEGRDYLIVVNTAEWRIITQVWKNGIETVTVGTGTPLTVSIRLKRSKWSPHAGPISRQIDLAVSPEHVYEFTTSIEAENIRTFKCDGFIYGQLEEVAPGQFKPETGDAVYPTLQAAGDAILHQFTRPKNLDI